jgi:hypothetical protein
MVISMAVSGGSPPQTQELLRVYADGRTVALIGTSWPTDTPMDEAGVYQMMLPSAEVDALMAWLAEHQIVHLDSEYGPRRADSGVTSVMLPVGVKEKRIRWGTFADVPEALTELQNRLRRLMAKVRRFPVQAFQVALELASDQMIVGQEFPITAKFTNHGSLPVRVSLVSRSDDATSALRLYAAQSNEVNPSAAPPQAIIHRARQVNWTDKSSIPPGPESMDLMPSKTWRLPVVSPGVIVSPGSYWLYLFVDAKMDVVVDDAPLTLRCFLAAQPVATNIASG